MRVALCLFLFLQCFPVAWGEFRCKDQGKIRWVQNQRLISKVAPFCLGHIQFEIISKGCLRDSSCQAMRNYRQGPIKIDSMPETSNPFHDHCRTLDGVPRLIEYQLGNRWKETGICEFPDRSYISVFNSLEQAR